MQLCDAVMQLCYAVMQLCYAGMQLCYAVMQLCYAGMQLCYAVMQLCYAGMQLREIFVLKNFHAIIFRVKIFSYASRPYENILTTKILSTKWHNAH